MHAIQRDVVVELDRGFFPACELIRFSGERQQVFFFLLEPGRPAALLFLEGARIQSIQFLPQELIELVERKTWDMPNFRQDPCHDVAHIPFDIGLVLGCNGTCRQDNRVVVFCHCLIVALDLWVIPVRLGDARFKIVGDNDFGNAPKLKQPHRPR